MHFAVCHLEDSPKWADGGNIWVAAMRRVCSICLPSKPSCTCTCAWDVLEVARDGILPEASKYDGLVLTGSRYNLSEPETRVIPWVAGMVDVIRAAAAEHAAGRKAPYIVGACFGAQLIGFALGGEVTKNPCGNFILLAEKIHLQGPIFSQTWAEPLLHLQAGTGGGSGGGSAAGGAAGCSDAPAGSLSPSIEAVATQQAVAEETLARAATAAVEAVVPTSSRESASSGDSAVLEEARAAAAEMRLLVSHGDCVRQLPPGAERLGSSASCRNEVFSVGRGLLALQSHPEFEVESCILQKILPSLLSRGKINEEQKERALSSFTMPLDGEAMLTAISKFIAGK